MNPRLHSLPLDLTGSSVNNLVNGELHDVNHLVKQPYRCFVLDHGYFYKDSLIITTAAGRELNEDEDYQLIGTNRDLMLKTGQTICSVVVITNPQIPGILYVTAQMVGGVEGDVSDTIVHTANTVLNTNRSVHWTNIDDKPDAYPASGHLHPLWQLYGFEGFIGSAQRVSSAIVRKADARYQTLKEDFDVGMTRVKAEADLENQKLQAHIRNKANPHRVTAKQVKLEKVKNFGVVTDTEARAKATTLQTKYMTPLGGALLIKSNFGDRLNNHVKDFNNPHKVSPAQVDVHSIQAMNNQLSKKLGINETAVSTNRLNGQLYESIYANIRKNLTADMIQKQGLIDGDRIGSGTANAGTVLTGNGTYRSLTEIFSTYAKPVSAIHYLLGTYSSAAQAISAIQSAFANNSVYPVGTLVVFTVNQSREVGTGHNGTTTNTAISLYTAAKTASGWIY